MRKPKSHNVIKVEYVNHRAFKSGGGAGKKGSPVRIFTNLPLSELALPSSEGYRLCGECEAWVSAANRHCSKCGRCTSKDGSRYSHCDACQRCVKPSWRHCPNCDRDDRPLHFMRPYLLFGKWITGFGKSFCS